MANIVRDLMTPAPKTVDAQSSLEEAAAVMCSSDVGNVLVTDANGLRGILTDRDIVIRAVAAGRPPGETLAGDCCSTNVHTVNADDTTHVAVELMRRHALRRLAVLDDTQLVGVLSIGDLAVTEDPKSALADISGAPPNR